MSLLLKHIDAAENLALQKVAEIFRDLRNKVASNSDFLAEMNATNATQDPGADYQVAYTVEAPREPLPQIPTSEELDKALQPDPRAVEKKELEKRFELEKESEAATPKKSIIDRLFDQQNKEEWTTVESGSVMFNNFCAWIINGEKDTAAPVTDARLLTAQETKKCKFTRKDFDHLQNLMWWRSELRKGKEGHFRLNDILSQSDTRPEEKPLWEALAKTVK